MKNSRNNFYDKNLKSSPNFFYKDKSSTNEPLLLIRSFFVLCKKILQYFDCVFNFFFILQLLARYCALNTAKKT